jgi:putative transposase
VTALACRDDRLFREPADQRRFIQHLRRVLVEHDWLCNVYCLMGTHFHLIPYTVSATLSVGMHRLLSEYAQWFNWKYDRRGHLFSSRFSSRHITDEAYFVLAGIDRLRSDPSRSTYAARPFDASSSPRKLAATRATASS